MEILVLLIIGVIGVLIIIGKVATKKSPLLRVHAKVIAKSKEVSGGETQQVGELFIETPVKTTYYIAFEFNNQRANFETDVSQYNVLNENDTGTLEYKDVYGVLDFINFIRDN